MKIEKETICVHNNFTHVHLIEKIEQPNVVKQ